MREQSIISTCIERFSLNLEGMVVFTEAATGSFQWTPIIALLAGASKVIAIVKDSAYGSVESIISQTNTLVKKLGCDSRLELVTDYSLINQTDIITNLGFVRPINASLVYNMKPTAVIPLMWETWEYRKQDLDLSECLRRDILVLGTNEHHQDLNFMDYIGLLVLKLLFEAGLEVANNKILVLGGGEFALAAAKSITSSGGKVGVVCERSELPQVIDNKWLAITIGENAARQFIAEADALVCIDHISEEQIIGNNAAMSVTEFVNLNPELRVIHVSGLIDHESLRNLGIHIYPDKLAQTPRTMSITPAYLGPRPVIELHTAGLKVGEEMVRARLEFPADLLSARKRALTNPLCQDFSMEQYQIYGDKPAARKS